ncbi:MAG TPA: glycosyltransferase family 87 protein [Candidatus Limnocylindria bacterium]
MQAMAANRSMLERYRPMLPAIYWLVTVIGAVWCFLIVFDVVGYGLCGNTGTVPCDAYSYWAVDGTPYTWETNLEYRYSPAFLWTIAPVAWLPFEAFLAIWTAAHIGAAIWLRAGWILLIPGLNDDVLRGNVSLFLAVAAVLALRSSGGWWAVPLLTKITPAIGMVWHLARGEWRALAMAIGVTGAIVAVGFLIDPGLWRAWIDTLLTADATYEVGHPLGPVPVRLAIGAAITAIGARTGRAWLVPIAMFVAVPGLWWFNWALLAGIPRLWRTEPA